MTAGPIYYYYMIHLNNFSPMISVTLVVTINGKLATYYMF